MSQPFKSGFVSIVGKPNVGKSTLLNALLGHKLVITTPKAQTTRHRILGIWNEPNHQAVFSDTPGIIQPSHALHNAMMKAVEESFEDADLILMMMEAGEKEPDPHILELIQKSKVTSALIINKSEMVEESVLQELVSNIKSSFNFNAIIPISALHGLNLHILKKYITDNLPEHPAYFPDEQLSDRNDRFFISEIVRKHILLQFSKEIPYSCEVYIESYQELPQMDKIQATIFVERESQKGILIGKGGQALKKLGEASRLEISEYLDKKVFLGLTIKVRENWKSDSQMLNWFGYNNNNK